MKAEELHVARCVDDLPIPERGHLFTLPNWKKTTPFRATAWAYLARTDGGEVVVLDGQKWHGTKSTVAT